MKLKYFGAEWCHACHEALPRAEAAARSLGLPLEVMDVEEAEGKAESEALGIRALPTLALLDGGRVRFRIVGGGITPQHVAQLAAITGALRAAETVPA